MPAVHLHGDARICGATTIVSGQSTVFINGKLASVQMDQNTHGHGELLADNNPGTLFINGKLVVLLNSNAQPDRITVAGKLHPDLAKPAFRLPHVNPFASQASSTVFAGGGSAGSNSNVTGDDFADPTREQLYGAAKPEPAIMPTVPSGTILSHEELYNQALNAGFSADQARIMAAIGLAESSGNSLAYNGVGRDDSYGLWQINMLGAMGPERRTLFGITSNSQLYDPATNAAAAYLIFQQQGFNAWSTYSNGAYRRYLK